MNFVPEGGIKVGELSLFTCGHAGRSLFGGSSNMAVNMMMEAAKNGRKIVWVSYEGPPIETLAQKL